MNDNQTLEEQVATTTTQEQQNVMQQPVTFNFDYEKFADVVAKRGATAEESALKGMLKSEGMSDDDVKQAITAFKEEKQRKANKEKESIEAIKKENEEFKRKQKFELVNKEASEIAKELKVKKDRFEALMKLSNKEKFTKEDGKIDKEAIKAEFEEQLKIVPEFIEGKKKIMISTSKGTDLPPNLSDDEEYRNKKYGKSKYYKG